MLNRAALIVRPLQPYIDWALGVDDSGIAPDPDDECTVYLVPSFGYEAEREEILELVFAEVFEQELEAWHTDKAAWPKKRTLEEFKRWFKIELNSMVVDLTAPPIIDDEFVDVDWIEANGASQADSDDDERAFAGSAQESSALRDTGGGAQVIPARTAKREDLLFAFEFAGGGAPGDREAYLNLKTGETYLRSMFYGDIEELPDDLEDDEKYIALPDKRDLGLGKPLALAFAEEFLPGHVQRVREIFGRRGAYSKFHELLIRLNLRDRWHAFEAAAEERALRDWCEENDIKLID
jgi:hypothetical protein